MHSYKNIALIALICFVAGNNAMENNSMVEIKSEKEIEPFVRKMIAYTTTASYFGQQGGYVLNDVKIKYGYVEDKGHDNRQMRDIYDNLLSGEIRNNIYGFRPLDKYYKLHQLLNIRGDIPCSRHVMDDELRWASLIVSNITQQEACLILDAVKNKKAKFDYLDEEFDLYKIILQWLEQAKK